MATFRLHTVSLLKAIRSIEYASPICRCELCWVLDVIGKFSKDENCVMQITL